MNNTKNILIIDDDKELCDLLKRYLESENYSVDISNDGISGMQTIRNTDYHLIILDVMLPKIDGIRVLTEIRKFLNTPVLMLTAKGQELDKVLGLRSGADDYLTKPFSLSELSARIESLIRRFINLGGKREKEDIISYGNIKIDFNKHVVMKNDMEILLTAKEYELIVFLVSHPNQVFSKKQIYQNVWEDDYIYNDNKIMALIRRARKKIEDNPEDPSLIQTAWGIGYRFHYEAHKDE